jgi:hypothetical protein
MSAIQPVSAPTLGAQLERDRLEYRASRLAVALAALRQIASTRRREPGPPPRHVRRTITDFEAQIATINARLRELVPEPPSARIEHWSGPDEQLRSHRHAAPPLCW